MLKSRATLRSLFLVVALVVVSVQTGCDTADLRTGSGEGSGGSGGAGAADAAIDGGVASTGGQGQGGVGTGGSAPPATGGATGGSGTGGSQTTTLPGSGGLLFGATGGSAGTGAGGSTRAGTGGTAPSTGGTTGAGTGGSGTDAVTVSLDRARQTMAGFGISNIWAAPMTDSDADALFDPTKGLGLTILRIGMNEYGSLLSNNIADDIAKAKARGVTTIIGSVWSPPGNCKSNNSVNGGGHLLDSCYASWSDTLARFAKENGLFAMSIANEPDYTSCTNPPCSGSYPTTLFTANEMKEFLKVAGPKLQQAGVKVIAPETATWQHAWSSEAACCTEPAGNIGTDPLKCGSPPTCDFGNGYDYGHALYKDATAWAAFDILGVHQYETQKAVAWPDDVHDRKPVWQTEMSGIKWWPEQGPSSDIKNGLAVAGWIHDALTVGEASAWLWWWYRASGSDDNEGLFLQNGTDTKRHYTFGNYTRFIRPGYTRVDIAGAIPQDVLLAAFSGTDGTVVMVAINKGSVAVELSFAIVGGTAPASMTPWVTSASDNLAAKTAIAVNGGSFKVVLDSTTVTTLVGK